MANRDVHEKVAAVQSKLVEQLETAQKHLQGFEKEMLAFGRHQRHELERLVGRVKTGQEFKAFSRKAKKATTGLKSQLDELPSTVLHAFGAASAEQVDRLTKKVDALSRQVKKLSAPRS